MLESRLCPGIARFTNPGTPVAWQDGIWISESCTYGFNRYKVLLKIDAKASRVIDELALPYQSCGGSSLCDSRHPELVAGAGALWGFDGRSVIRLAFMAGITPCRHCPQDCLGPCCPTVRLALAGAGEPAHPVSPPASALTGGSSRLGHIGEHEFIDVARSGYSLAAERVQIRFQSDRSHPATPSCPSAASLPCERDWEPGAGFTAGRRLPTSSPFIMYATAFLISASVRLAASPLEGIGPWPLIAELTR